jgi:hypothetical protein
MEVVTTWVSLRFVEHGLFMALLHFHPSEID